MINKSTQLISAEFDSPLGPMVAISDSKSLHLLEFSDMPRLDHSIEKLQTKLKSPITSGVSSPITSIKQELNSYFEGNLKEFKTPFSLIGTSFQKRAWKALINVPYGETRSYKEQAMAVKAPLASRAIGSANGANLLVIIVPCHRIISHDGSLGGYGGGLERKKWLIEHERKFWKF
jgi:AraC family transcriptional regulator of adaptative response/methylated-DNA-[protein]-cysteine methyltransferase